MNKIKDLELKRMLQEYQYLLTDVEYRNELIEKYKSEFLEESYVEQKDEDVELDEDGAPKKKEAEVIEVDEETAVRLKKIYREIVKLTHPDKVQSEYLNGLYLEATDAVKINDIYTLYKICVELDIEFDMGEGEKKAISKSIDKLKKEIEVIENSYIWTWINSKTESEKKEIANRFKEYCKNKLG